MGLTNDEEYLEHAKREATTRWKWKNPMVAAALALILGPVGLLYVSWKKALVGIIVVFVGAEILRYNGWWPAPTWLKLLSMVGFAVYAYTSTRMTNAAIEFYKYGLPGTGVQKPTRSG